MDARVPEARGEQMIGADLFRQRAQLGNGDAAGVFGNDGVPGHPVEAGGVADGMKPVDHLAVAHVASLSQGSNKGRLPAIPQGSDPAGIGRSEEAVSEVWASRRAA